MNTPADGAGTTDSLKGLAYGRVNRPAGAPVPAIAVHGLRKRFGDKEAVAGIDLDIAAK